MLKIQVGNGFYFMYICIAVVYAAAIALILRRKSRKTAYIVLLIILFLNFSLHFIKQAFVPYINNLPQSIRRSTVENLCAVSTVFFPFIFLIKKQTVLHDFMYFIGVVGGIAALFYPTEALGMSPFAFDTVRFYICHTNLMVVPLTAAIVGLYRPRLSKFWAIPLMFLVWEAIICLNEFFLMGVGLVDGEFSDLLNAGFRNSSFAFGVRPDFAWAAQVLDPLVPWFFKTDAFHINGGEAFYFPVLWLIGPAFAYLIPVYIIVSSPFWIYALVKKKSDKKMRDCNP